MGWAGGTLTVAGRWFASSQIHLGCACRAAPDASESSAGQDARPPGAVGGRVRPAQPGWPQPMRPEPETEPREGVLAE